MSTTKIKNKKTLTEHKMAKRRAILKHVKITHVSNKKEF